MKEEEGGSDADEGSVSEMKECGEGDGDGPYLSELEPAASESEDGFSLPTPSLQRYAPLTPPPAAPPPPSCESRSRKNSLKHFCVTEHDGECFGFSP